MKTYAMDATAVDPTDAVPVHAVAIDAMAMDAATRWLGFWPRVLSVNGIMGCSTLIILMGVVLMSITGFAPGTGVIILVHPWNTMVVL